MRQIRSMGQQMGNHLKTIQDDIQRLQACHTRPEHPKNQLPNYQASSLGAACWNAKMLHQVLIEFDLGEAAAVLLTNNISGRAFHEAPSGKEDLEALGITDQLTLRRLMNLQDFREEHTPRDPTTRQGLVDSNSNSVSYFKNPNKCQAQLPGRA